MAPPADKSHKAGTTTATDSQLDEMRVQQNNLTIAFRALCAQLDTSAVAGGPYVTKFTDASYANAPALVQSI
jgi:hypothetical protein